MGFAHDQRSFELTTIDGIRAAWESDLDWSPDGRRIVCDYNAKQRDPPFTGHLRVYEAVLATGRVQQLIPDASGAANPDYWDSYAVWPPVTR